MKAEIFAYEKWAHNIFDIQTSDMRLKQYFPYLNNGNRGNRLVTTSTKKVVTTVFYGKCREKRPMVTGNHLSRSLLYNTKSFDESIFFLKFYVLPCIYHIDL